MSENLKVSFGNYVKEKREDRRKSLRETAKAIEVSPQFYSEVEKGRRGAFTPERLEKLKNFLVLDEQEATLLYDLAAKSRTTADVAVPQDFADYVVEHPFVAEALRLAKETDACEEEWQVLLDELKTRKG